MNVKGLIKTIIVAGVTFAAGYVTCRHTQETYYLEMANRKLKEQDEEHKNCVEELEKRIAELSGTVVGMQLETIAVIANQESAPVQEDLEATVALTSYQSEPAQLVDYTQFSGKAAATNVATEISHTPRHADVPGPRLIPETEFLEAPITFVFTLYVGDDTLTDETDQPITAGDRSSILGHLDGGLVPHVNPEGNVFIYNTEGNYAAQICVSMGSYSEVGG